MVREAYSSILLLDAPDPVAGKTRVAGFAGVQRVKRG